MSCSKPVPPFIFDSLYYLNRDQLERFSIVCRPLKNFIDRYFQSKPYRVFDRLRIRGGSYSLEHNGVQWHPNRDYYSAQQFLAGQKCSVDRSKRYWDDYKYYSFAEMQPYLGPTVRIKKTDIVVAACTYNSEHIEQMESISYLWRDGWITIWNERNDHSLIGAEDLLPILSSPTILQCNLLFMNNPHFSFKDCKVLYSVNAIEISYGYEDVDPNYWTEFLEQPGLKPIVVMSDFPRDYIDNLLDRLSKVFSSAVLPNAFKLVFVHFDEPLIEFRETNKTSGEILQLKKGAPMESEARLPRTTPKTGYWMTNTPGTGRNVDIHFEVIYDHVTT
ncbi:hypothetical protein Ddc_18294 [Ditylenchus destructor]|nr:hypothetical protein Ddc_18294 [Ditylenchus destructor]